MCTKQIKKSVLLAAVVCAVLGSGGLISPVHAQSKTPTPTITVPATAPSEGINVTLSPVFINVTTDPGTPVSSQFKVKNNNSFTEYFTMKVGKFSTINGESPTISELDASDTWGKWISFSEETFAVTADSTKTVKFTISPTADAALGYYYALQITRVHEGGTTTQTGSSVSGVPAIPVLLEVRSPNAKRELQLEDFKTDRMFYEELPVQFQVKVKNTGNVHVVPSGDIFIDWGGQKDIGVLKANDSRGNVLPQTERTYTADWTDGFIVNTPKMENGMVVKDEHGNPQHETKWDLAKADKFRVGRYTAHLLMVYDNGTRDIPVEATVSFWVIPWKILLVGAVILYFAVMGIKNTIITNLKKLKGLFK